MSVCVYLIAVIVAAQGQDRDQMHVYKSMRSTIFLGGTNCTITASLEGRPSIHTRRYGTVWFTSGMVYSLHTI